MPGSRMLPHTCTLRNYVGESDGRAAYQDSILSGVKCEPISKSARSQTGADPLDRIRLFIFDLGSRVTSENGVSRTFVSPDIWNTLSTEERLGAWTAADDKDRIVFGGTEYLLTSCDTDGFCNGYRGQENRLCGNGENTYQNRYHK